MSRPSSAAWTMAFVAALAMPPASHASGARPGDPGSPDHVSHYAVVVTGPAFDKRLDGLYWACNQRIREMLRQYGYPGEAVYCLADRGPTRGPGVGGRSTLVNLRKIFRHLAQIMKDRDQLFIFLIGHGGPSGKDFIYVLNDGRLTGAELNALLDGLPTRDITLALNPCFSGGFIPKLSGPGRVICTSTNDAEENAVGWAEAFTEALLPRKGGDKAVRRVSIKQAYNAALDATVAHYHGKPREHPLLDDNGDGVGHFGKAAVVGGDGKLAARRFLGDQGHKLVFQVAAVEKLRRLNTRLVLCDLARVQRVFAAESVYLGTLGGYENDVGANSTREDVHLAWARRQPAHVVAENLVTKYLLQFDRQARRGRESAEHFFAEASARIASYGIDLGDKGASLRDVQPHLDWAKRQTMAALREGLETKLRALLASASDPATKGSRALE